MSDVRYAIGRPFTTTAGQEGDFAIMSSATAPVPDTEAGYDPENVRNEHIQRLWRSTITGDKVLTVNLATSQNPDAILIENCNFTEVDVRTGADSYVTYTLDLNPRTGRYGRLINGPAGTGTDWDFRVNPTDAPNHTYCEIGRIVFVSSGVWEGAPPNNIMQNAAGDSRPWWQPYTWRANSLGASRILAGGITETTSTSPVFLDFDLEGSFDMLDDTEISHPLAYTRMLTDQRILHWEDRTEDTNNMHAYLCRRDGPASVSNEFPYLNIDMNLVEVI